MHKNIQIIVIIIELLCYGIVIITGMLPNFILDKIITVVLLLIPIFLSIVFMFIQRKNVKTQEEKNKVKFFWLKNLFLLYCLILIEILFLQSEYRLSYHFYNKEMFSKEHFLSINLIPFKTIIYYFYHWNSAFSIVNFIGNLLLFMPMAFFVIELFSNKIKNIKQFALLMFIITCSIEIMQFLTYTGRLDVDDVILNVIGACIGYLIVKNKY